MKWKLWNIKHGIRIIVILMVSVLSLHTRANLPSGGGGNVVPTYYYDDEDAISGIIPSIPSKFKFMNFGVATLNMPLDVPGNNIGFGTVAIGNTVPNSTMLSGQGIRINNCFNSTIAYIDSTTSSVNIVRPNQKQIIYCAGKPTGEYAQARSTLLYLKTNMESTLDLSQAVYLDRVYFDGTKTRFSVATKQVISVFDILGKEYTRENSSSDIIRDLDGIISSIITSSGLQVVFSRTNEWENGSSRQKINIKIYENSNNNTPSGTILRYINVTANSEVSYGINYLAPMSLTRQWTYTDQYQSWRDNDKGKSEQWNDSNSTLLMNRSVSSLSLSQTIYKYAWGGRIQDESLLNRKNFYSYYSLSSETGRYGKIKRISFYDNSWIEYDYNDEGLVTKESSPFKDSQIQAKSYSFEKQPEDNLDNRLPRLMTSDINGSAFSKQFTLFNKNATGDVSKIIELGNGTTTFGDSANLRVTNIYDTDSRVKTTAYADGQQVNYTYEVVGTNLKTTAVYNSAGQWNTKTVFVTDRFGQEITREYYVHNGTDYIKIYSEDAAYSASASGLKYDYTASNGKTFSILRDFTGVKFSETTSANSTVTYDVDLYENNIKSSSESFSGHTLWTENYSNGIQTNKTINAYDYRQNMSYNSLFEPSIFTVKKYNCINGETNSIEYDYVYDYDQKSQISISMNDTIYKTINNYYDGNLKSVVPAAGESKIYDYDINSDGTRWMKTSYVSDGGLDWNKTTHDFAGRVLKTEKSSAAGVVSSDFNYLKGNVDSIQTTGKPPVTFQYDDYGNITGSTGQGFDNKEMLLDKNPQFYLAQWTPETPEYKSSLEYGSTPDTVFANLLKVDSGPNNIGYNLTFPRVYPLHDKLLIRMKSNEDVTFSINCVSSTGTVLTVIYSTLPVDVFPSLSHTIFVKLDENIKNDEWVYITRNINYDIHRIKSDFEFNYVFSLNIRGKCAIDTMKLCKYDDSDNDRIPDQLEDSNGMDRMNPYDGNNAFASFINREMNIVEITDVDHDGLDDNWEIAVNGNLDATSTGDSNNNGLTNAEEYLLGIGSTNIQVLSSLGLNLYSFLK